jgi:hypothetical protein
MPRSRRSASSAEKKRKQLYLRVLEQQQNHSKNKETEKIEKEKRRGTNNFFHSIPVCPSSVGSALVLSSWPFRFQRHDLVAISSN